MPAPPSTDKKQKSSRKVRPALRPSGGSGVGALVSATAVAADGNNIATGTGTGTGNPTMMALLESLDKDLHGPGNTLGRPSQPLTTPNMAADGACIIGRLSDIHNPTLQSPSPASAGGGGAAVVAGELAPVAPSHGSTEALPAADDGSENENGGSNEAGNNNNINNGEGPPSSVAGSGGNADHGDAPAALPPRQEGMEPVLKDDPEFTFDPVSIAQKKQPGTNGSPASASAPVAEENKEDSPSLPAKRARKNTSSDPTSPSYFKFG